MRARTKVEKNSKITKNTLVGPLKQIGTDNDKERTRKGKRTVRGKRTTEKTTWELKVPTKWEVGDGTDLNVEFDEVEGKGGGGVEGGDGVLFNGSHS